MSEPIAYFGSCGDLSESRWTKIGSTENWASRSSTYKTGYPLYNIIPYFVILTKNIDDAKKIETIFLKEYENVSTTKEQKYKNGGREWITIKLTLDDIQLVLKKNRLEDECELLHDDALDTFLAEAQRKEQEMDALKQKERDDILQKHMASIVDDMKNGELNPIVPRGEHQVETFDKIINYYKDSSQCVVNWTCGLGKTFLALWILYHYKKVLIGVPSVLLIRQWIKEIKRYFPHIEILAITASAVDVTHTTRSQYVDNWILGKDSYILISTYHSSHIVKHLKFDFKVLDECHHLCQTNIGSKFYKILHIESEKQLALTATLKAVDDENMIDNFSKESFGEIIDTRSTLWAINNKYITDYEVVTMRIEQTTLCAVMIEVLGNIVYQELFLAAFVILESMIHYQDLTHIIAYTNTIESARVLNDYIDILLEKRFVTMNTNFYNKALDSKSLKSTTLDIEIKSFETADRGVISSVYIFGEGVSIPAVNGECVAESMESEIRIVQSMLRGSRLNANYPNKINKILLPHNENEQNTFEKVETVIAKMGNQDANIEQRIRACVISSGVCVGTEHTYIADFNNVKELDHVKLKLRHRSVLRMPGVSQIKSEYLYLRSLNMIHKVKSKSDYFINIAVENERLEEPQQYFERKDPTVWRSWYDFLGINVNLFPLTKDRWREKCQQINVTSLNYLQQWEQCGLPEHPTDLYRDFKTIRAELGEKKERRC